MVPSFLEGKLFPSNNTLLLFYKIAPSHGLDPCFLVETTTCNIVNTAVRPRLRVSHVV